MKNVFFIFFLLFFSTSVCGQPVYKKKAVVKEVKAYHKANNFAKADETLRKAFAQYPAANTDAELYHYEVNTLYELAMGENRKIYLNNNPDTVKYFTYIFQTYQFALKCDSLDCLPDEKGRVKRQYEKNLSTKLAALRNNLRSGGKFYYKKGKYAEAYSFFDLYLSTIHHPLLEGQSIRKTSTPLDVDSVEIAEVAVIAAYGVKQYQHVLKYLPLALSDSTNRVLMLEIGAKSHEALQQNIAYVDMLKQGFELFPQREYFYSSLIQYYNAQESHHQALDVINLAIERLESSAVGDSSPNDSILSGLWFLKGKQCQILHELDSAVSAYRQVLRLKVENAEAYAGIGEIRLQQAHDFYEATDLRIGSPKYASNRKRLNEFYHGAMEAYEQARHYAPERRDLWLVGLREVYYKLGEGKKLRDLE